MGLASSIVHYHWEILNFRGLRIACCRASGDRAGHNAAEPACVQRHFALASKHQLEICPDPMCRARTLIEIQTGTNCTAREAKCLNLSSLHLFLRCSLQIKHRFVFTLLRNYDFSAQVMWLAEKGSIARLLIGTAGQVLVR